MSFNKTNKIKIISMFLFIMIATLSAEFLIESFYHVQMKQGELYEKQNDIPKAIKKYENAVILSLKNNEYSILKLVNLYLQERNYSKAEQLLKESVNLNSFFKKINGKSFIESNLLLANVYEKQEKYLEALSVYDKLLATNLDDNTKNTIFINIAYNQINLNDYNSAAINLNKVLAYDKNNGIELRNSVEYLRFGLMYYKQGNYKIANNIYSDIWLYCIETNNCTDKYKVQVAINYYPLLLDLKKYDKAIKTINDVLELKNIDYVEKIELYLSLGSIYLLLSDDQKAKFYINKSKELANINNNMYLMSKIDKLYNKLK